MEDYDSIDPVASTLRLELLHAVNRILPSKQSLPYNRPLIDQRLALRWIKRHIIGFGGDPERVTFIGESAGGGSGCFHLHSDEPLFHQLISMGGTSLLRPRRAELLETSFRRVAEVLGAKELSPEEQVQKLLTVPMTEIRKKVGRQIPIGPMLDGDMIPVQTTFEGLADSKEVKRVFPGIAHCKRILIGDCQMDAMALAPRLTNRRDSLLKTLVPCLSDVFDDIDSAVPQAILSAYALHTEATKGILNLGNDLCFAVAARSFARAWSGPLVPGTEAFLYRFDCPNPWDGPWKGYATHILDIAFALQNYAEYLSPGQRASAERFAKDIITFVQGKDPWPAYRHGIDKGTMVYYASMEGDQDMSQVENEDPEKTGRNDNLAKLVKPELLDKLMEAWQMFTADPR